MTGPQTKQDSTGDRSGPLALWRRPPTGLWGYRTSDPWLAQWLEGPQWQRVGTYGLLEHLQAYLYRCGVQGGRDGGLTTSGGRQRLFCNAKGELAIK